MTDVCLFVPFIWPRIETDDPNQPLRVAMNWNNGHDGWFTPHIDGTKTNLLVTLRVVTSDDAPDGQIAAGRVAADETLREPFNLMSTGPGDWPEERLQPGDRVPCVDLGDFSPGEVKTFDLEFTYHWSDGEGEALRTSFSAYTLAHVDPL